MPSQQKNELSLDSKGGNVYVWRPVVSLPLLCATSISMVFSGPSACGQGPKGPARIAASETTELFEKDPTPWSDFKTPQNVSVQLVRRVNGGVQLRFHTDDGVKGTVTVVGPPTVMTKRFFSTLIDVVLELAEDASKKKDAANSNHRTVVVSGNHDIAINIYIDYAK